jgi:hypothetical protein
MGMDPELRRHYLHALGVQVWRPRLAPATDTGFDPVSLGQPEPLPALPPLVQALAEAPGPHARINPGLD